MPEQTETEQLAYWQRMLQTNLNLVLEHAENARKAANRAAEFAARIEQFVDRRIPAETGEVIGCMAMIGCVLLAIFAGAVMA